jgi:hypothetical protein
MCCLSSNFLRSRETPISIDIPVGCARYVQQNDLPVSKPDHKEVCATINPAPVQSRSTNGIKDLLAV